MQILCPATSILDIHPATLRVVCFKRHGNLILNSPKVEITQMSTNNRMNKLSHIHM